MSAGLRALVLALVIASAMPARLLAQAGVEAGQWLRIAAVELDWDAPVGEAGRKLEADIRRRLGIFPGSRLDASSLDFALARLRALPGVADASAEFEFSGSDNGTLIVHIATTTSDTAARPRNGSDRLTLRSDDQGMFKARVGLKSALALSANQWFDNGDTLTEFNPRGRYDGGRGPNGVFDLAPSLGFAAALPLGEGEQPAWAYASALYLAGASIGQDNNRNDARFSSAWEEAFVGIVDGGVSERGSPWRANVSFGRQPYCIGNGMLLCQIAASGGDRAADFAWPRWSGHNVLKAQLRINDTLVEGFRLDANDAPSTETTLAGVNLEQQFGSRAQLGATWLSALDGELRYFRPDGSFFLRDGLRVWQLRGRWQPLSGESGIFARGEYARQTHADADMRADGWSAEGGYAFGESRWQPSISLRWSATTGDDPSTQRFERWDLLYSGGDIDTCVQGQLMKNIHYNSNVRVERLLARATPTPKWRLTAAASRFRADERNNFGGVIAQLADEDLGHELLLVAEHYISRQIYLRLTAASLWPASGVRDTLPRSSEQPWLVAIAQINVAF